MQPDTFDDYVMRGDASKMLLAFSDVDVCALDQPFLNRAASNRGSTSVAVAKP